MGPYMRPIPINASAGMLLSLAVALIVTPWLCLKLIRRHGDAEALPAGPSQGRLHAFFERLMRPFLVGAAAARRRLVLFAAMLLLVGASAGLAVVQLVVLKMLPFDNKSEFQVVLDMPEGVSLEATNRVLQELALEVAKVPEVASVQAYAGTSAPVNFNGLVRQYYLREGANVGDLQVNLVDKTKRKRKSHDIARAVRPALAAIGERYGASVKVVEVPPGPPVMAPLVAEIYGPDPERARELALALADRFRATAGIVDVDSTVDTAAPRDVVVVDRARAARLGVSQQAIVETLAMGLGGYDATHLRDGAAKYAVPVRLRLPAGDRASLDYLLGLRVRSASGALVPVSEVVSVRAAQAERAAYHKDLKAVSFVFADEAGALDSPLYGMFDLVGQVADEGIDGLPVAQYFFSAPEDTGSFAIKWDGEWQITFETFRDMGLAYAVGLVLIYLLVVGQFRSYGVPLVIMAPIPLTVIGVMPGHALLGAQFTATSMIGMIALAGIIVRNSILLVDFIDHARSQGRDLAAAVIEACAVRAKPIALTAVAAMAGGVFLLDDPIFNGLAVSLLFGIFVSTVLTLLVIPLLYAVYLQRRAA
jgi:multidrug efflux pump subunit AcrB